MTGPSTLDIREAATIRYSFEPSPIDPPRAPLGRSTVLYGLWITDDFDIVISAENEFVMFNELLTEWLIMLRRFIAEARAGAYTYRNELMLLSGSMFHAEAEGDVVRLCIWNTKTSAIENIAMSLDQAQNLERAATEFIRQHLRSLGSDPDLITDL